MEGRIKKGKVSRGSQPLKGASIFWGHIQHDPKIYISESVVNIYKCLIQAKYNEKMRDLQKWLSFRRFYKGINFMVMLGNNILYGI